VKDELAERMRKYGILHREGLQFLRERAERGDPQAIVEALRDVAGSALFSAPDGGEGLPMPTWLAGRVHAACVRWANGEVRSLDEALEIERPGFHEDTNQRRIERDLDLHTDVLLLVEHGYTKEGAFEIVGRRLNASASAVRDQFGATERALKECGYEGKIDDWREHLSLDDPLPPRLSIHLGQTQKAKRRRRQKP
jgi:hypothetical protein